MGNRLTRGLSASRERESGNVRYSDVFPWYLGFALSLVWLSEFSDGVAETGEAPWINDFFWVVLGLASLAWGMILAKTARDEPSRSLLVIDATIGLVATLGVAPLLGVFFEDELTLIAVAVSAVATAWVLVRWGVMLSKLTPVMLVSVLAGCALLLVLGKIVIGISAIVPLAKAALFGMLPLVSALTLGGAGKVPRQSGHVFYPRENEKDLLFVALFILLFGMVLQLLDLLSRASQSSPLSLSIMLALVCGVSIAALVARGCFDFRDVVRLLLVTTALGSFTLVASSGLWHAAAFGLVQGVRELTRFYFFAITADIARHSDSSPAFLFGVCWFLGALARLPFLWMNDAALDSIEFGDGGANSFLLAVLLLLLLTIMAYSLLKPPPGIRPPLSDPRPFLLGASTEHIKRQSNLDCFAEVLVSRFGLTSREVDVARLICQGRGRSYIADTLYISENTVKFHSKNLYRKIGITSKNELLDLFEAESRAG